MSDVKVKTPAGREITLRRPAVLAQLRLVDAIGDSAANRVYLGMCMPLIYVAQIDGADVPPLESKKQVEALFQRLDEDGLVAVNEGIAEHFSRDEKAEIASAKKSQGRRSPASPEAYQGWRPVGDCDKPVAVRAFGLHGGYRRNRRWRIQLGTHGVGEELAEEGAKNHGQNPKPTDDEEADNRKDWQPYGQPEQRTFSHRFCHPRLRPAAIRFHRTARRAAYSGLADIFLAFWTVEIQSSFTPMKTYQSFGALARALERVSLGLPESLGVAMEASALLVETTAKAEIGTYQTDDMGPFKEWAPLKESTIAEKRALGYADEENDNPLLRTGEMRDSIGHTCEGFGFVVGSTSDTAVYQELGTSRGIPPRPFLAPALYRNVPAILNLVGASIESTLAGK